MKHIIVKTNAQEKLVQCTGLSEPICKNWHTASRSLMTPEDHKALVAVTKSLQSTTTITALLNERCTKVLITNEGTQDVKVECLRRMMWNGTVLGHRTKLKAVIHFTKTCTHERHVFF